MVENVTLRISLGAEVPVHDVPSYQPAMDAAYGGCASGSPIDASHVTVALCSPSAGLRPSRTNCAFPPTRVTFLWFGVGLDSMKADGADGELVVNVAELVVNVTELVVLPTAFVSCT
eukprot:tig00000158_g10196.t1